jgi:transposase
MKNNRTIEVKPYNNKELAAMYEVGRKTMVRWLKAHQDTIGKKEGKLYTSLQVKIIFEVLGPPPGMEEE